MGEITLVATKIPDLLPSLHRSPGIHVSDVIHYICEKTGIFKDPIERDEDDPDMTWMQLGCALEDAIARRFAKAYPGRYIRIGELEEDGLYLTPDLWDQIDKVDTEIKFAWMSSRHEPDSTKMKRYWWQVMAYCYVLETLRGRLIVVHAVGDWGANRAPVANTWEQTFTRGELRRNWDMLKSTAETTDFYNWLREHSSLDRKIQYAKMIAKKKARAKAAAIAKGLEFYHR